MNKILSLLVFLSVLLSVLLMGCGVQETVQGACDKGQYEFKTGECCADINSDSICDKMQTEAAEEAIRMIQLPPVDKSGEPIDDGFAPAGHDEAVEGDADDVKRFNIRAYQFAFEPNMIEVEYGDDVMITVTSLDVAHGFAIPEFGVNEKIPPEDSIVVSFTADTRGEFTFFNSVYSGKGWKNMTGKFVVK